MGCWNKTCGLSNLHIVAGTPVYVFVLERAAEPEHCYATGHYRPLLLPFESEYDDYGGGENSGGIGFPFIMHAIKQSLREMEQGDNQYHDIPVNAKDWGEQMFFEAVHEDRLFIKNWSNTFTPLTFTMMRKDIVDKLIATRRFQDYVGDGKGTTGYRKSYVEYTFDDVMKSVRPLVDLIAKKLGENERGLGLALSMGSLRYFVGEEQTEASLAARWLSGDGYRYSRLLSIGDLITMTVDVSKRYQSEKPFDKLEELLKEWLKGEFVNSFMEESRKLWMPAGHEGSQGYSDAALMQLYSVMKDVIENDREEDYDDTEAD
jgi:hypothetical protein